MRRFEKLIIIGILIAVPMQQASAATPVGQPPTPDVDVVFFPPLPATCHAGQPNLLMWNGQSQVTCLPIPTCPGPGQYLHYDGQALTCLPS